MKVEILCFAALKDFFPIKQTIEIEFNFNVSQLKEFLGKQNPNAVKVLNVSRVSINQRIVKEAEIIPENAIIAILPPSSGG
ncbi:MoaD/ThiS family protein [Leptospira biflexa]|jgi:molybdopterin converting factor small subunit|uniref:MoaD/ThiS family protein n=1 Tax=Leptospira biflexa TaxID=172 RepID=UPI0010829264|nr:MoaD/ThiS family protein [Leptospira biflexa]TGM34829.1 MoaD/ThiS family protein [Leptospira biflexa]TGM42278.1 MoaD/ThiS family protein [Leptospira biflexa]TGM52078.1 MoaD/ThiS family protein [Leptospira biflexa]